MGLDHNKIHRIAVEDLKEVVLNMVYAEVGDDEYEVFGVYSGVTSSGPHVYYFHQNQSNEITISDDCCEFKTNHGCCKIFNELDESRVEFENWDDEGELTGFTETGKNFLAQYESINDDGWVEAYSSGTSEDFIYALQDEWQIRLYKN